MREVALETLGSSNGFTAASQGPSLLKVDSACFPAELLEGTLIWKSQMLQKSPISGLKE